MRAAVSALRDAWLIVGITLALLVTVEATYRLQGAARHALTGELAAPAPPSPLDAADWWTDYNRDHKREEQLEWSPYVYFRNPTFVGTHIRVDDAGHRITPQPTSSGGRVVFFLGGSTIFGWFHREPFTIPALVAQRLPGLRATNFGVPGRTFTQELIDLMLQLQAGARPDVVVFYDGINDVGAAVLNRAAGFPMNEASRAEDFKRGRQWRAEREPGLSNDVRVMGRLGWAAIERLEVLGRLASVRTPEPEPLVATDILAASLTRIYAENVRMAEALGARYGFTALYVWQPVLMSTGKPLTAREAWLLRQADDVQEFRRMKDLHRIMPPMLRDAVAPLVGERFIDATAVFDTDPEDVFADLFGHTYERGNPAIVDVMVGRLSIASRGEKR